MPTRRDLLWLQRDVYRGASRRLRPTQRRWSPPGPPIGTSSSNGRPGPRPQHPTARWRIDCACAPTATRPCTPSVPSSIVVVVVVVAVGCVRGRDPLFAVSFVRNGRPFTRLFEFCDGDGRPCCSRRRVALCFSTYFFPFSAKMFRVGTAP